MKRLNVTVTCMAVYNSGIDVPNEMILEEAIICPLYQPVTTYLRNTKYEFKTDPNGSAITRYIDYNLE